MADREDRTIMGVITGAHGIKGEVKITSFTQDPLAIAEYKCLADETGGRSFAITNMQVHKGNVLIARIKGVSTRNEAEALKGTKLSVERALLPSLEEEEFYYADLVGLKAYAAEGQLFGQVRAVQNFGAGDLLEIESEDDGKTIFLPFTKQIVPHLDVKGGKITVLVPEGYLEEEQANNERADN